MAEHSNVELVRRGYEAFGNADYQYLEQLYAPDVRFVIGGKSQFSGTRTNRDEVFKLYAELGDWTDGTLKFDIDDIVGGDDHVVVLVTAHARNRHGAELHSKAAHVATMQKGKIIEFRDYEGEPYVADDFWG